MWRSVSSIAVAAILTSGARPFDHRDSGDSARSLDRIQPAGFHGALARIVDLPTVISAYRCEPVPRRHTRIDIDGVRHCSTLESLANGADAYVQVDSTGRVISLGLGWPRTPTPEQAEARLESALALLEPRLGRPTVCGRSKDRWRQPYHWQTAEWAGSLSATRIPITDSPSNVEFVAWIKAPDELVTCMDPVPPPPTPP